MQEQSLFTEGLNLLTLGMGFVFIFLVFLVFATTMMSRLVSIYVARIPANSPSESPQTPAQSSPNNAELIAIFASAIHKHRLKTSKSI